MKTRGLGRVYQPTYTDKQTGARKTAGVWWIAYSHRGIKYRKSSRSTHRADAVRLLKKKFGEIGAGRFVGPSVDKTTFEDLARILLNDYRTNNRKSLRTAEGSLKALRQVFGTAFAWGITMDGLTAYVAARLEAGRQLATIQKELAALKRAFHLAEKAGKAVCPPFPTLTISNTRAGFFEEPDHRAVVAHLPADLGAVAEFAYFTGWRKGEILGLAWRNVDFTHGSVRLEPGMTKNDKGRTFPFAKFPALADLLRRQREHTMAVEKATGRIIPWVFHRRSGSKVLDFRGAWERACEAAGVPGRLFHDYRRTAVRFLERAGVARSVATALTGHKTESVFRRYAITNEADFDEGITKLAALHRATVVSATRTVVPLRKAAGRGGA